MVQFVYSLCLDFYFWQLYLGFKINKSCVHDHDKMCKNHKPLVFTELIFDNIPKANGKI